MNEDNVDLYPCTTSYQEMIENIKELMKLCREFDEKYNKTIDKSK